MKCLIIDNYDSFTYNLYQDVAKILSRMDGSNVVDVIRNDEKTLQEIKAGEYDRIIISPGPGNPTDPAYFGVCAQVITDLGPHIPLLGVCLGMQGIVHCFGGTITQAAVPMHGRTSVITHDGEGVFTDIPNEIEIMRYHSLVAQPSSLPPELIVTATAKTSGEIMGVRHKTYPIEGVQFHPESFASEGGEKLLENFIKVGI